MNNTTDRLREIRKNLGVTQEKFAKKLGCSYRTYQNYENSKSDIPGSILQKLATMGYNINWLLTGEGEMTSGNTDAGNQDNKEAYHTNDALEFAVRELSAQYGNDRDKLMLAILDILKLLLKKD